MFGLVGLQLREPVRFSSQAVHLSVVIYGAARTMYIDQSPDHEANWWPAGYEDKLWNLLVRTVLQLCFRTRIIKILCRLLD
ncbi:hypothetical protein ScPMuIL_016733 [Solemya velum]